MAPSGPLMCEPFTATTRETTDALTSPRATSILPLRQQGIMRFADETREKTGRSSAALSSDVVARGFVGWFGRSGEMSANARASKKASWRNTVHMSCRRLCMRRGDSTSDRNKFPTTQVDRRKTDHGNRA
ncbi:hypothetical protein AVEN_164808-1 [Araneus ventricosus]|uniref:Uncharacterized protein n=1 Tax=Araneus ventricosus TaxID=182803 RepID=A0A4Y2VYG3_ARAVE|nr:hypothetical protein AVEN_164808-1 [Araneus ventricosus]